MRHELSANPLGRQLEPQLELRPRRPFRTRAHSLLAVLPDVTPQLRALVLGWICGFLLVLCWQVLRVRAAHPQASQGSRPAPTGAARSPASIHHLSGEDRGAAERRTEARTRAPRTLGKTTRRVR
jgi:hypothetical protein